MKSTSFFPRLCARVLLTIISLQLALGTQYAAAQTAPVTPVPADGQTNISKSANGTAVANIAAPNSAGVSHNLFTSYNVGAGGLVLNNSSVNAVSVIGGGVAANGNLAGGRSASLILNEVTSANPSLLAGYQEIVGPAAELVIANPYGITCNGCGFVNTPRVTLATGLPTLNPNGALAGFTITGGQLAIGPNGLDATRQSSLDLLARSVAVAGNVIVGSQAHGISGDLQVLAGANRFDYATRTATAIAGTGPVPEFAIDSSLLGGMYADRIRLLVNEQGAGVRIAGNLAALADDLDINANGRIELRGAASAARDFNVSGTDVLTQLADSGTYLYGGRDLSIGATGALDLGVGSIGALRNLSFNSGDALTDAGGVGDLRFTQGGALTASSLGALTLGGGYWTASRLTFSAASIGLGGSSTLYGSGVTGDSVNLATDGLLSITGGKVYSAADAALDSSRLEVNSSGVVAAAGTLSATVARGSAGGIDNAGVLQGDSVNIVSVGNAPTTPTTFHNGSTGTIFGTKALSIGDSGANSAAGSTLANDGTIAGGTVTVGTTDTSNTNAIQATNDLDFRSATLENTGRNAVVIGSTNSSGTASIKAATITNSGTIWSAGDLSLTPTTLTQQRDPAATSNPLIGAGRDLTIAYTGKADLGTGDLQAGRDLAITGSSISDRGLTGSATTAGDLRYAGGNLTATAADGGSISIAGGQWYSKGDLRLTGDSVGAGFFVDPVTGFTMGAPGVQLVGAQGGVGVVALTARTGSVGLASDASVFSGGDLAINQPSAFFLGQSNVLQAGGLLSINAADKIDNAGTIVGGTVSLSSNSPTQLFFANRSTGIVYGSRAVQIGTAGLQAGTILVDAPASANAGLYGGALNFNAGTLVNNGTIQGVGPGSVLNVGYLGNNATGRILGFTDANGLGGITINTPTLVNSGFLYDSSNLNLNATFFENLAGGVIGSAGLVKVVSGGVGGFVPSDNQGQILGDTIDLTFGNGFGNGSDPGVPANRGNTAMISANRSLNIANLNGGTLTNYGTIESGGDLKIDLGNGVLRNTMSMVPDSELVWVTDGNNSIVKTGDLGFVTVGANGSSDKTSVTVGGATYYWFNQLGGSTQAYLDSQQSNVQNQDFATGFSPASVPTPTIRAGGNLQISNFQSVSNVGTISGVGDVNIQSANPGSTVQNTSLQFGQRDAVQQDTATYTCRFNTGITDLPTSCAASPNEITFDGNYLHNTVFTPVRPGNNAFTGKILAGGNLNISAGSVVNGFNGQASPFTVTLPGAATQTGAISVTPAGAPGARGGAATLNVNGAQVALPTSPNGRFVPSLASSTAPLIEANPLFGIDSLALGSDYLVKLLGLNPDQQIRRLGDSNYEDYLIQQQIQAQTGRSVLEGYGYAGDMDKVLFDNAAVEAKALNLGYGKALTSDQVASLKSDIVWLVEEEVQGQKVVVPVVYLSDATRASVNVGAGSTLSGYNVNIQAGNVQNIGGDILARNGVNVTTTGNIENLSGNISGWNVMLNAGGDVVNSTLVTRLGNATNGVDVAQRTATIEAGSTAILKAAHDVTVNGGWVTAGKDAALIAGNNVNVQSVALTKDSHSSIAGNYTTSQTQTAQGGGVLAGGNAVLQAGQDVNLKGAEVAAGGTTVLNADRGNVNVGVLELKNSSTSSRTGTGLYTEVTTDSASASVGIGFGLEQKTTTHSTSTTTGVGSNIAGNQVVVTTGKGDVNINGSAIDAGKGGVVIDSANDVNITAYNSTNKTTDTTNTLREGFQFDASADGAYSGNKLSSDTKSTTSTQTGARTSSLSTGGDLLVLGKGTITNEGTRLAAAGDVILDAQNVINKAAHDTFTTTTSDTAFETKQQIGITTNGTGASINNVAQGKGDQVSIANPEAQVRVTGSYSTGTTTDFQSTAQATQIAGGGNVVVLAQNSASDEGTQYKAGKDVVISAADYVNKAAADVSTSTNEATSISGQATVGVDTTASVNITASAEGSHTTSSRGQSTARVGAIDAGGSVVIDAKAGDVSLEGTRISGAQGVGISAARDININQANDSTTSSSSEQSGSGRLSASVSLVGAGAAVGVGASTRLANSDETASTAKAANISSGSGDVQLDAGRDLTSQGAGITAAGDVALKARGDINLLAATDKVDKTGSVQAGGADVNVGFGTGAAKGSGSVGVNVNFESGQTDYHENTQHGSDIQAGGNFSIDAGGSARLQGTQVDASTASLRTGGNLTLESAQHTVSDNSYDVSGNLGITASKGGGTGGAAGVGHGTGGTQAGGKGGNAGGANAQVNVSESKQDIETNTNASIKTSGGTTVDVGGDLSLKGANIDAQGGVSGRVAGNLDIETRTDKVIVDQTNVNAYAGLGPVGGSGGGTKGQRVQEGVSTAANQVAQTGVLANVNSSKKDDLTVGTASGISGGAGGIDLRVGGNTTLKGATNAGSDFKTQGRTTIENVQTHTNDSSTAFRAAGTVASLAGSNDGSGGTYGLTIHVPHGAAGSEPTSPNTKTGASPEEEGAAHENPLFGRPVTPSDQESRRGPVPTLTADNQVVLRQPRVGDRAPAPNEPTGPRVPTGVAPESTAISARHQLIPEDSHPNNHVLEPQGDDTGHYLADDADNLHAAAAGNHGEHLALVDPQNAGGAPELQYGVRVPAQDEHGSAALEHHVGELISQDEHARVLRDQGAHLDPNERVAFERNLAEAVAFSQAHPESREPLFAAIEDSLRGPTIRADGLTEFPVRPQYAGENIPGFDHWKNRAAGSLPGATYSQGEEIRPITYFTPEQQERARLFVDEDGKLTFANGAKPDGRWIFVVDEQGRLLATPYPQNVDAIHHSSLSAGKRVLIAGEFRVIGGHVADIKDQSGHFRPDTEAFKHFLVALHDQGVDLTYATAPAVSYVNNDTRFHANVEVPNLLAEPDVLNALPNGMLDSMRLSAMDRARITAAANNHDAQPHADQPSDAQAHPNDGPPPDVLGLEEEGLYNNEAHQNGVQADDRENVYARAFDGVDRRPAPGHAEDPQHAALDEGNPPSAAPVVAENQPHPNPHEWTAATRAAVSRLVTEDPQVRVLHERGSQLSANDRTFFDRNLAEVEAYTRTPVGAQNREQLLHALDVSVRGPGLRSDGLEVFPLLPQFVGEDVPGFDNWYLRKAKHREKEVPGAEYAPGREPLTRHIDYLSAADQEEARVFVHEGQLVSSESVPLAEGKYIFVVDQEGRLIAQRPVVGRIHHSSLSGGQPVLTAGEFEIDGHGKLTRITNQSGHFRPSAVSFEHFVAALEGQGVDLDGVQALALKLTTATNGNFDVDNDFTNLLDAQHHGHLQAGPAEILAPLAHPDPAEPVPHVEPIVAPQPADRAHEESYGNRPTTWLAPRQLRGWGERRSVVVDEPALDLAA